MRSAMRRIAKKPIVKIIIFCLTLLILSRISFGRRLILDAKQIDLSTVHTVIYVPIDKKEAVRQYDDLTEAEKDELIDYITGLKINFKFTKIPSDLSFYQIYYSKDGEREEILLYPGRYIVIDNLKCNIKS